MSSGEKPKTIFRVAGRHKPYTQICNAMLRDRQISIEARGALAMILTNREDWLLTPDWLCKNAGVGRDKGRSIVAELIKIGYAKRTQDRSEDGTMGRNEYLFSDEPNTFDDDAEPSPENPARVTADGKTGDGEPGTGLPATANPPYKKTTNEEKDLSNNPPTPRAGDLHRDTLTAFEAYNAVALRFGLPQAAKLTPDRKRKIVSRLRDYGLDGWTRALANIEKSAFLTGRTEHGFRADLDFVCQAKSFGRLHDGGYCNGTGLSHPPPAHMTNFDRKVEGARRCRQLLRSMSAKEISQ